jgi:26S proteasome regulatory subunit N11
MWCFCVAFVAAWLVTATQVEVMNVGKVDPKKHLEADVTELLANSIVQCLGTMIDTVAF